MTMREATGWIAMFVLLTGLSGCASLPGTNEPTNRYAAAAASLDVVTRGLTIATEAGLLDDGEIVTADYYIQIARSGLAVMKGQLPNGGTAFEDALELVSAVVTKLQALEAEARTRKGRTNGPTAGHRTDQGIHRTRGVRLQGVSGAESCQRVDPGADCRDRGIAGRIFGTVGRDCGQRKVAA